MGKYSTIAIPHNIKKALEERAGERPIFQMLNDEFLHEPDTDKLIERKFDKLDKRINYLEKLIMNLGNNTLQFFGMFDKWYQLQRTQISLTIERVAKLEGKPVQQVIDEVNAEAEELTARIIEENYEKAKAEWPEMAKDMPLIQEEE